MGGHARAEWVSSRRAGGAPARVRCDPRIAPGFALLALLLPLLLPAGASALGADAEAIERATPRQGAYFESLVLTPPPAPTLHDRVADPLSAHFRPAVDVWWMVDPHALSPELVVTYGFMAFFESREIALLAYDRDLRWGTNDVLMKVRTPGNKRSFLSFEFVY